ncbi:XrtA/PEP-CTERM system-associated ATPase [Sphingobium sp. AN641]|uniref:XrtA/PEP-CTERM system-associated ATPase n=1 Tax=Sphingobium sp. AN641 TaxID=3133443 RepID=UPI0030C2C139
MYDQFYALQGRPFQLTPDPHFYFESATHRKALSYLGYGLAQGEGFIVITGDIGAGKTTLVSHLMETIDPSRLTAVKIVSTQVEGDDMLRLAAQSFGVAIDGAPKAQLLQRIEAFLHAQARAGRRSLLIVDEAQNLPVSAIEELRMLSNFQLGGQSLLQIFLLGQPEFRDLLKSPELEQLRQRVIATHHLEPMMAQEVEPYIIHRLSIVGWAGNPAFTPQAFAAIYAATGGVPRRVNALASRVLLMGAIDQLALIDADVVRAVVDDMNVDSEAQPAAIAPSPLDADVDVDVELMLEPAAMMDAEPAAEPDHVAAVEEPDVAVAEPVEEEAIEEAPAAPFAMPQPAFAAPAFTAAPVAGTVDNSEAYAEIEALREEVAQLRAALVKMPMPGPLPELVDPDALRDCLGIIDDRLNRLEASAQEQDAALRRVLTLLVDWVEREDQMASTAAA